MKSKNYIIGIFIVLGFDSCNAQKEILRSEFEKLPSGKWINVQDSLNMLVIKKNQIIEFYNNQSIDTTKYRISKQSCDGKYTSPSKSASFLIKNEDICYEIIDLTEEYIELVFTSNGKTITYRKK